ncbi:MAG: cytoplasmic protein [Actinomycetota bacterium]
MPDSLDAVVAAPEHHSVLLENDRVRVLDARVEAGDTVPVHTHRWPGVQYIVSFAELVRCDGDGEVLVDSRAMDFPKEAPLVLWSRPLPPHTLENVGDDLIHVIVVELKDPPAGRP